LHLEVLETRELLATFTVMNLHNSEAGSLRQAIIEFNARPGADIIDFDVAGTIRVGRTSLPVITDTVTIDGCSASSFGGSPVVTVDFQRSKGFRFEKRADGSILRSLSLVRAGNAGVTLTASHGTVEGNYIGLRSNGKNHRRQPWGRRADQCLLPGPPDRAERSGSAGTKCG